MLSFLQSVLENDCFVKPGLPILVGVSGGADSLSLLHALQCLGYPLVAAHYDHSLRPESGADAAGVQHMAERLGLPFTSQRGDVPAYARQHGLSLEAAARQLRYAFLFSAAQEFGAQAVAVGHNAGDQVETLLLHLLRGAGLDGLAGMRARWLPNPWSERIPLIRPLLGCSRRQIEVYLQANDLQPIEDPSNQDMRFTRNAIRHELLPHMRQLNPQLDEALQRTASLLRDDHALLQELEQAAWEQCQVLQAPGAVALDAAALRRQPVVLQRRLLRRAVARLHPGFQTLDMPAVQRALEFLAHPPASRQADFALGLRLELEGPRLWLAGWQAELPLELWPQLPGLGELRLPLPGELALPHGWRLRATAPLPVPQVLTDHDAYQAWLDASALPPYLTVRPRRPGERMQPLGMDGRSQKLSDLMINLGAPRRSRRLWPLVCLDDQVIWAPGLRQAESARVVESTVMLVRLVCERVRDG